MKPSASTIRPKKKSSSVVTKKRKKLKKDREYYEDNLTFTQEAWDWMNE